MEQQPAKRGPAEGDGVSWAGLVATERPSCTPTMSCTQENLADSISSFGNVVEYLCNCSLWVRQNRCRIAIAWEKKGGASRHT